MSETLPLDLLIRRVTVVSAVADAAPVTNAMIGIRGSRIASIGPDDPAATAACVLDLPGRVVTPGFINVHTHAILCMVRGVAADVGFAPSYTPGIPNGADVRPEEARALARLGALEALLFGSTLIADNFIHADATVDAMAELGLRVHAAWRINDVDFAAVARGHWTFDTAIGDTLLRKALDLHDRHDGTHDGRVRVHLAPHAPDTCSDSYLRRVATEAHARGTMVATHLAQSPGEVDRVRARSGRSPAELLEDVGLLDDRLVAAHCIHLDAADIARIGAARVNVAHVPKCNAASGRMAPIGKLRSAGANLTLATDTQHGDMVELMRWALAVARIEAGRVADDWQPEDVLAMATRNGARAIGLAPDSGTLVPGAAADLVAFDFRRPHLVPHNDPVGTLVHTGQGRDVDVVIVDGRIVVERGVPTRVDADAILREGAAAATALWKRARV
jgi:5-methylthioadenosine/S-adenosylhomocysteine deaminase